MTVSIRNTVGVRELQELLIPSIDPGILRERLEICHTTITHHMGSNGPMIPLGNLRLESMASLLWNRFDGIRRSPTLGQRMVGNIVEACIKKINDNDNARNQGDRQSHA